MGHLRHTMVELEILGQGHIAGIAFAGAEEGG
jgi:hypothetical protein